MNIKTLIPYDKENPLQARVLAADPVTQPYSLYHSPIKGAVDFAKEVAKYSEDPSKVDEAHILNNLMSGGETILIEVGKVEQLILSEEEKLLVS